MFESKIERTKLAGSLADCMFRRINGCDYQRDVSFISTLRALLMDVDLPETGIKFSVLGIPSRSAPDELAARVALAMEARNTITYVAVDTDVTDIDNECERFFAFSAPDGAHEFEDVREFFSSKMDCRAFVRESTRSSAIVVRGSSLPKYHLVQCILPKLLPWLFSGVQLSAVKRDLLYSLRERRSSNYVRILDSLCETDDFRSRAASAMFLSIQRRSLERQKQEVENSIANTKSRIENFYNNIQHEYQVVNKCEQRLSGILIALENPANDEALTDFLSSNPHIQILTNDDSDDFAFVVKGYLDVYDPEAYRTLSRNPSSWYWNNNRIDSEPFLSRENRKLVLDAVFGDDPQFRLKTFGVFKINFDRNSVSAPSRYDEYGGSVPVDCFPNPHLYYAGCLGSYRTHITAALAKGDVVGAISQCISSAHSVNVTESATFGNLCQELFRRPGAFLEAADGTCYTAREAYDLLVAKRDADNAASAAQSTSEGEN